MSARVVVVMGVSGSGKTTVGKALAERLGWAFMEGDRLHPPANIAKMAAGVPLTDADRAPWLAAVAAWIDDEGASGKPGVIACSALKRAYRERLTKGRGFVRLVFLEGEESLIADRIAHRTGHFMPPSLLASQFATLEPPTADENPIEVSIDQSVGAQVEAIVEALGV